MLTILIGIVLWDAVEIELAMRTLLSPVKVMSGLTTPVVSQLLFICMLQLIVCIVSGGICIVCFVVIGLFGCSSGCVWSIAIVRCGKCSRPWLTSSMALLFLRKLMPSIDPVMLSATMNVSLKDQSPISNCK